ncbi:hypothetical protein [Sphingomonas sp. 3F27F9]|uniref:hypothetical protein n=1 Tax=unclassified Sphingomonas TaxID=196159 RepID=UPI001BB14135|nr:hypothetical protein [Sphingomonas sp. 3F27F9]
MQQDRLLSRQAAFLDIETDVMPAIGKDGMFAFVRVDRDGKPRRDEVKIQAVGIRPIRGNGGDGNRCRIEIDMPDNPGLGRSAARILGESEAPMQAVRDGRHG